METELNKFSLNSLASFITPGALIVLFLLWGVGILFPHQPNYIKDYEVLSVFLFITAAYVTGTFISNFASLLEKKIYKVQKFNPRLQALDKKHHWTNDLDKLYFENTGLHIFEIDKETGQPKQGDINGKKIDKFTFEQFDRFANFYLRKNTMHEAVQAQKEKYLLFRNLSLSFYVCLVLTGLYCIINILKPVFSFRSADIFFSTFFVIGLMIFLSVMGIVLFNSSKRQRVVYLEDLYRNVRYCYLLKPAH